MFTENIFVFVIGTDYNLYADFTPDATPGAAAVWTWQALGAPPETTWLATYGAVVSTEVETNLSEVQMFVFAMVQTSEIYSLRWDGSKWTWYNQFGP